MFNTNFLRKHVSWIVIIGLFLIIISFCIGLLVKNWPLVSFDREIKITDVASLLLSLFIAFLIPYFVNYFIDKGNKVNEIVISEVTRYRQHVDLIHESLLSFFQREVLTDSNKSQLNVLCEILDSKYGVLEAVLKQRCKEDASDLLNELKKNQIEYWKVLTSTEINSPHVERIHPVTFNKGIKSYQEISDTIMRISLMVSKY